MILVISQLQYSSNLSCLRIGKKTAAPYMAFRFVELSRSPHSPIAQCGYQTVVGVIFPVYIRMYRYERFHQNYQALRTVALNKLDRSQRSQKVARRVRNASTTSAARGSNGSHDVCSISPCESALVRFSRPHTVVGTTVLQF